MTDEKFNADAANRVEEICKRFEADWRRGERPVIDEYLAQAEPDQRDSLRQKLFDLHSSLVAAGDESESQREHESAIETVTLRDRPLPATSDLPNIPGYVIVRRIGRGDMGRSV
jgi:hypothetical protein